VTRYRSLDLLRGLGVALMVFLHGTLYQYGGLGEMDFTSPPVIVVVVGFLLMWAPLFAVVSGAAHGVRTLERYAQGVGPGTVLGWSLMNGALMIVFGVAYFAFFGPAILDLAGGRHDYSMLVGALRTGTLQLPSVERLLYMNTLHMIGFGTLLAAPLFALAARGATGPSAGGAPRTRRRMAFAACAVLGISWLRIPLFPVFQEALAEGRYFAAMGLSWLVSKNDPMLPSLGFVLLGAMIGTGFVTPARRPWAMPAGLGLLLLAGGIAGWAVGPDSMLERSIDWTWYSINLIQAGVLVAAVPAVASWIDAPGRPAVGSTGSGPVGRTLRRFGTMGLSVLFAETLLAELLSLALRAVLPEWNRTMAAALAFGATSVAVWAVALALWERRGYPLSVERLWVGMLRALGKPTTKLWIPHVETGHAPPSPAGHH